MSIAPAITLPVHLPGYKFTLDDYYAYEQQRAALLSDPRIARAALLRGRIVWRLAVAMLSFDDVLEGPTTVATLQRRGIVIRTSDDSVDLCESDGARQHLWSSPFSHRFISFTFLSCLLTIFYP